MNSHQPNYYPPQPIPPQEGLSGLVSPVKVIFSIAIPLLWFIALFTPAYSNGTQGGLCLLFGWTMLVTGNFLAFLAWFANFLFWIGFFMFVFSKRKKTHVAVLILAAIGFLFSFGALTVTKIEGGFGTGMEYVDPTIGAWIWMFSIFLLLSASIASVARPSIVPEPQLANPYSNYPPQNYYQNYPPQISQIPPQQYSQPNYQQQYPLQNSPPPNYQQQHSQNYQPPIPQHNLPPATDDSFPTQIPQTYIPPSTDNPFTDSSDTTHYSSHNPPTGNDNFPSNNDTTSHHGHDTDTHHHH